MPAANIFPGSSTLTAPHLFLYPLQPGAFVPKHINLAGNQRVKIGRQTNVRTQPSETNGYFDSKVLSRAHAEVWEENGKIYMKDVKSSNGTFINSERLSPEGLESEPWEIKTTDVVEFGIDIVGEDNKSIVHHKVAAKAICVFTEEDYARAEQQAMSFAQRGPHGQHPQASGSNMNGSPNGFAFANQRRPQMQPTGLGSMGAGMVNVGVRGKSGMTVDHILHRLQGELKQSRETSQELHNLSNAMGDIHETLGGALPQNLPPYPQVLPPVRPPQPDQRENQSPQSEAVPPAALSELQIQLQNTQNSLATHVEKIHELESVLAEHDAIKREVGNLRDIVESTRNHTRSFDAPLAANGEQEGFTDDDDDDAASIATATQDDVDRIADDEDEEHLRGESLDGDEEDEQRRRRRAALGRPRTPEPNAVNLDEFDEEQPRRLSSRVEKGVSITVVEELTQRLSELAQQHETALSLFSTLQTQHTAAQSTISALESKLSALETLVQDSLTSPKAAAPLAPPPPPPPHSTDNESSLPAFQESLTETLNDWKKAVEGQWSNVQEEWSVERARLGKAREEWEAKAKGLEEGLASLAAAQISRGVPPRISTTGGGGLATPPSPTRSVSSDSGRNRARKRRNGSKGRSRSGSRDDAVTLVDDEATTAKADLEAVSRTFSPSSYQPDDSASDSESSKKHLTGSSKDGILKYLETPEASVHAGSTGLGGRNSAKSGNHSAITPTGRQKAFSHTDMATMSTSVGVVVLSLAAAAVIWRVKE